MGGRKSSRRGVPHTEETKNKISVAQRGDKNHMWGRKGKDNPSYGQKRSDETRLKMSKNHTDYKGKKNPHFGIKSNTASSKYFGVTYVSLFKRWVVRISLPNKRVYIGKYKTEKEAAMAYNEYIDKNNIDYPKNKI